MSLGGSATDLETSSQQVPRVGGMGLCRSDDAEKTVNEQGINADRKMLR